MSIVWSGVSTTEGTNIAGRCLTRPLASVRGQTFSSWHESSCGIPKGGLLVLFVCGVLGIGSAHDLLRCCVTRCDMSIVWSGVSTTEGTNIAGRCLY